METYLKEHNWKLYGKCSCSGTLEHTYRRSEFPMWKITIFPQQGSYEIYLSSRLHEKGNGVESLKNTLKTVVNEFD